MLCVIVIYSKWPLAPAILAKVCFLEVNKNLKTKKRKVYAINGHRSTPHIKFCRVAKILLEVCISNDSGFITEENSLALSKSLLQSPTWCSDENKVLKVNVVGIEWCVCQ